MRTISEQIKIIKETKKIGLMTHVVAGYPSLKETEILILQMEKAGVDLIEIQIPFSDPMADGPAIMKANDVALENKVTITDTLQLMKRLINKVAIPLLFMGYYNSLFHYGVEKFCKEAKMSGAQGLIIPDIPVDEEVYENFIGSCKKYNLSSIRVLSPTSTNERIRVNVKVASGFIYCTAISGTTGSKNEENKLTKQFLQKMRSATKIPLAVGFGISTPDHIKKLIGYADIAVVGSAVIKKIEQAGMHQTRKYIESLVAAGM